LDLIPFRNGMVACLVKHHGGGRAVVGFARDSLDGTLFKYIEKISQPPIAKDKGLETAWLTSESGVEFATLLLGLRPTSGSFLGPDL
jgi:hypothetical protein